MPMSYIPSGCPIRFSLSIFGDRWSLLIIRDIAFKKRRFYKDFLEAGEGISTNILADRLEKLEESGVIVKQRDPSHGKRFIYSLTEKGLDLIPVLLSMVEWAERYDEQTEVPDDYVQRLREDRASFADNVKKALTSE